MLHSSIAAKAVPVLGTLGQLIYCDRFRRTVKLPVSAGVEFGENSRMTHNPYEPPAANDIEPVQQRKLLRLRFIPMVASLFYGASALTSSAIAAVNFLSVLWANPTESTGLGYYMMGVGLYAT